MGESSSNDMFSTNMKDSGPSIGDIFLFRTQEQLQSHKPFTGYYLPVKYDIAGNAY